MNAMVQDMSWDMAARQEGSEITALSSEEVEEVNGGWIWVAAAIVGAGVAGFGAGTFFGWLSTRR